MQVRERMRTGAIEGVMLESSRGGVESWLQFGEQVANKKAAEKKNASKSTLVRTPSFLGSLGLEYSVLNGEGGGEGDTRSCPVMPWPLYFGQVRMSRALQDSFRRRTPDKMGDSRASTMHFRTKSLLEQDIQEAMASGVTVLRGCLCLLRIIRLRMLGGSSFVHRTVYQADALDILEAVDSRRSMCDLAKDSLFFEGGLTRSYHKVRPPFA
jgi:hypothetical protein